jgi:hypothetical protein
MESASQLVLGLASSAEIHGGHGISNVDGNPAWADGGLANQRMGIHRRSTRAY